MNGTHKPLNAVNGDARLLITEMMDHGLSDAEVRVEIGGLMPETIDSEIAQARRKWEGEQSRMRAHAKTTERQPIANEPTDGAALLDKVCAFLRRFVVYPSEHVLFAHVLWIVHTHAMKAFESTPRIAFLSPEPGSGKTRALEVTEPLVPRPVEAVNVTPAYLFRKVADEAGPPTILFDEIDTVFGPKAKDNEEIRGLLNAGHRKGAVAGRCVVKGKIVMTEEIPAYCAVALAGLGALPDTISSRAVIARMRRRAPDEVVEPWRRRIHAPEGEGLRDQLAVWAANALGDVIDTWPEMPEGVRDRDADVWEALLCVADVAGGHWPERARVAAVALVTESKQSSPSLGIRLLADIRAVFDNEKADKMWTKPLLTKLAALEDAPWSEIRGKPLTGAALAKLLKGYGIKAKSVRFGEDVERGYAREDFHDPWKRYLPALGANHVTGVTDVTPQAEWAETDATS